MKLKKWSSFVNERLGILEELDELAQIILKELSNKSFFKYKGKYLGKDIIINCFLDKPDSYLGGNHIGSFQVEYPDNLEFNITIEHLNKSTLIHELKHMDRVIRRNVKVDAYHYINHIGRLVAKNYSHLFKNKRLCEVLIKTFYLCNPDEFEAYYHSIYEDLKEVISEDMSRDEKNKIIENHLEHEEIFILFRNYYRNPFNIENFFKSKEDCNFFIKEFFYRQDLFYNEKDETIKIVDKIKSWLKSTILNKIIKDKNIDNTYKEFNYYINKVAQDNYRKFSRLYSLFVL